MFLFMLLSKYIIVFLKSALKLSDLVYLNIGVFFLDLLHCEQRMWPIIYLLSKPF